MPTLSLATFAGLDVTPSQAITLLTRIKSRVATTAAPFCSIQETSVWFPMPDGVDATTLPPPTVITNSSPVPANSVALPPDFDDTDLCYMFEVLLAQDTAAVYAEEVEPIYIVEPFVINYSLLGVTRTSISVREYPYELVLPGASIAAVTRSVIQIPTYILSLGSGTFTATGQAAGLGYTRKVIGAAGSFALAGQPAIVQNPKAPLSAETGVFTLTGESAGGLALAYLLNSEAGPFTLEGQPANLSIPAKALAADAGSFALTGYSVVGGDPAFSYEWTSTTSNEDFNEAPINTYYRRIIYQTLYTTSNLSASGITASQTFNKLQWNITDAVPSANSILGMNIRIFHTSLTEAASGEYTVVSGGSKTTVYSDGPSTEFVQAESTGIKTIDFLTPFTWNGTNNIVVETCTSQNQEDFAERGTMLGAYVTGASRFAVTDDSGNSCSDSPTSVSDFKPSIRLMT